MDPEGLLGRVVGVPVIEAKYSGLRAVKGGLAWLREPVAGVLGEGAASPEDDAPRPLLERFDLRKREVTELVAELDWFDVSGDGTRLAVKDHDELRILPSEHKEDHGSGESVTVDLSRARFTADPAALWQHAYAEAGPDAPRLLGPGHVRGRLGRRARGVPAAAGPDPRRGRLHRPDVGSGSRAGHLARLHRPVRAGFRRVRPGRRGRRAARRGHLPRRRRPLGGGPGAPRRVVRPAGALAARGARRGDPARRRGRRGGRTAGRPGARPRAAAGRHGRQAGRAHPPRADDPAEAAAAFRVVVVPLRDERRLRYQDWVAGRRGWSASSARESSATCTSRT